MKSATLKVRDYAQAAALWAGAIAAAVLIIVFYKPAKPPSFTPSLDYADMELQFVKDEIAMARLPEIVTLPEYSVRISLAIGGPKREVEFPLSEILPPANGKATEHKIDVKSHLFNVIVAPGTAPNSYDWTVRCDFDIRNLKGWTLSEGDCQTVMFGEKWTIRVTRLAFREREWQ